MTAGPAVAPAAVTPVAAVPAAAAPATATPETPASRPSLPVTALAVALVLMVGLRYKLPLAGHGSTTATLADLLLLPVCLSAVSPFRYARTLLVLTFTAVAGGTGLALLAVNEYQVSTTTAISEAVLILTGFLSVGVLLWAARVLTIARTALLYGLATLAGVSIDPSVWHTNPWKYAFALPSAIALLSLLGRRSIVVQLSVLGLLGVVSAAFDYRSFFGFCMLTGVLLAWQQIGGWKPPRPKAAPIIAVGGLGIVMYYLGTTLLVDGVLGRKLQERSEAQIQASGSLLIGGRPEWTGTVELMKLRPQGYGMGVIPGRAETIAVKTGFAGIHVDYNNGYIEHFMLGSTFRLHSIVADLWAATGVFGLLLCAMAVFILTGAFTVRLATRTATPLFIFMALLGLWDLGFGTSFTNLPDVTLALALALFPPPAAVRLRRSERLANQRVARMLARRPTVLGVPPTRGTVAGRPAAGVDGPRVLAGAVADVATAGIEPSDEAGFAAEPDQDALGPDETQYLPKPYRYRAQM